jgi:hypothetical protein
MKQKRHGAILAAALQIAVLPSASAQTLAVEATASTDWRENYAYAVGLQAVIYGYPVVKALNMRYGMVEKPVGVINAPINQLFHIRRAADATDTNSSSSATDFLYTVSVVRTFGTDGCVN